MSPEQRAQIQRRIAAVATEREKQQPQRKPKTAKPARQAKPGRRAA